MNFFRFCLEILIKTSLITINIKLITAVFETKQNLTKLNSLFYFCKVLVLWLKFWIFKISQKTTTATRRTNEAKLLFIYSSCFQWLTPGPRWWWWCPPRRDYYSHWLTTQSRRGKPVQRTKRWRWRVRTSANKLSIRIWIVITRTTTLDYGDDSQSDEFFLLLFFPISLFPFSLWQTTRKRRQQFE